MTPEELAETQVWPGDDLASHTVHPRSDGSYEIHHVAPGDWAVTAVHGPDDKVEAPLHLPPRVSWATLDFTFVRGDRKTLSGHLSGGDPLASYLVEITPLGTPEETRYSSSPDLDGIFRFTGLRSGRYRLRVTDVESSWLGGGTVVERTLDLTEDRDLEIELPPGE